MIANAAPVPTEGDVVSWKAVALGAGKSLVGSAVAGALGALAASIAALVTSASAARDTHMGELRPAAAALVLLLCGGLVPPLAIKRAIASGLALAIKRIGLGARLFRLVIDRMLRVDDSAAIGERGNAVARAAERVPLAQAAARLRTAVDGVTRSNAETATDAGSSSWIRRKVRTQVLASIEQLTLARFRAGAATEGGVDLVRVRDELGPEIDEALAQRVASGAQSITVAVAGTMVLLPFLVPAFLQWLVFVVLHLNVRH